MKTTEMRKVITELKKTCVEVQPGLWVNPKMIAPNGTIILEKRVWEKMIKIAEELKEPDGQDRQLRPA